MNGKAIERHRDEVFTLAKMMPVDLLAHIRICGRPSRALNSGD